jgi:hypothetical protein
MVKKITEKAFVLVFSYSGLSCLIVIRQKIPFVVRSVKSHVLVFFPEQCILRFDDSFKPVLRESERKYSAFKSEHKLYAFENKQITVWN